MRDACPSPSAHSAEARGPPPRTLLVAATKCTNCFVRGAGVCDAVPNADLARLSAAATIITLKPGQRFIEEGDSAEHFFTLSAGTARLLKMLPNGRQQITSFPGPGDFLGLAMANRYSYAAEAVENLQLCRFSRPTLRRLMADFPAMEQRLLEYTSHELVLAQEQMLLLGRKSAIERMASFLVARAHRAGHCPARGAPQSCAAFTLPMPRTDIADYIGLRIETISRTLGRLRTAGLIDVTAGTSITIHRFDTLEAIAVGG